MAAGFLLAAGLGTRLRPLTQRRPKPLVPVCGVPMLDYSLALARQNGIGEVIVNAHYLAEQVEAWAERQDAVRVSVELPEVLGTGGGLRRVMDQLDDRFAVVNGDTLCDIDLRGLMDGLDGDRLGVLALRRLRPGETYGVVLADAAGVVVDMVGLATAPPQGPVVPGTHFTGVYALRREALTDIPPTGFACIKLQGYVHWVPQRRLGARLHAGTWFDVGTPESYLEANLLALTGQLGLPLEPMERAAWAQRGDRRWGDAAAVDGLDRARITPPVWIGRGVSLGSGCQIGPGVVIGDNATLGDGVRMSGSVIWERCVVPPGTISRSSIVFDGGVLCTAGASAADPG